MIFSYLFHQIHLNMASKSTKHVLKQCSDSDTKVTELFHRTVEITEFI